MSIQQEFVTPLEPVVDFVDSQATYVRHSRSLPGHQNLDLKAEAWHSMFQTGLALGN